MERLTYDQIQDIDINIMYTKFIKFLTDTVNKFVPKFNSSAKSKATPWWNESCYKAIKDRNKAKRLVLLTLDYNALLIKKNNKKASAQHVIRSAKNKYWQSFCNTINCYTTIRKIWQKICFYLYS